MTDYKTVSESIDDLRKRGYIIDFNVGFDGVQSSRSAISLVPDKFMITEIYRFERETSPDDKAVVYTIESKDGHKGILVNGYGVSSDPMNEQMIKKLTIKH